MTLLALQRDMRLWLDQANEPAAARLGANVAPGLLVYQNNYRSQLAACLEEAFPHTQGWMGGEAFHNAMVAHVARVPPSSWTLDAYPRDFPETLALLYPDDPEIAELAWIEHALAEAFVGKDADAVTADALGSIDWDRAVLEFVPTLDHAPLATNAPSIWAAMEAGTRPPEAELLPDAAGVFVWRHGSVSRFRTAESDEVAMLLKARAGETFAQLCEVQIAALGPDEGVARAGSLLGSWISDSLIASVKDEG